MYVKSVRDAGLWSGGNGSALVALADEIFMMD